MITYYRFEIEFFVLDELEGLNEDARDEIANMLFANIDNSDLGVFYEFGSKFCFNISSLFLDEEGHIVMEAYMCTNDKKPLSEELWEKVLYKHSNYLANKFNHLMESIRHGILKELPVVTPWGINPL